MRVLVTALMTGTVLLPAAAGAQAAPGDSALVVHTTVTTQQPRSGMAVQAQVWVSVTGEPAENATLSFSAEPTAGVAITPVCTRTPQGYCKLGDLDETGATIPFTIKVTRSAQPVTVKIGAWTRADNVESVWEYTTVKFAPAAAKPKPKPTTTVTQTVPAQPTQQPAPVPVLPTTPLVPQPQQTDPSLTLPQVMPPATTQPQQVITQAPSLPPAPSLTTQDPTYVLEHTSASDRKLPAALALGQSIWLGILVAACAVAAALLLRHSARIRRRRSAPDAKPRTKGRRRKNAEEELPPAVTEGFWEGPPGTQTWSDVEPWDNAPPDPRDVPFEYNPTQPGRQESRPQGVYQANAWPQDAPSAGIQDSAPGYQPSPWGDTPRN